VVYTENVSDVVVGGDTEAEGNIVGNSWGGDAVGNGQGIYVVSTNSGSSTKIKNNIVGLGTDGDSVNTSAPNIDGGIWLDSLGDADILNNVVASNQSDGINLKSGGTIRLQGNIIGASCDNPTAIAGFCSISNKDNYKTASGNTGANIHVGSGATITSLLIGGATSLLSNVIGGSFNAGILIEESIADLKIMGNYIGIGSDESTSLGNQRGVVITKGDAQIGGDNNLWNSNPALNSLGEGNIISHNAIQGIYIKDDSVNVSVFGNVIGLAKDAVSGFFTQLAGNGDPGVLVENLTNPANLVKIGDGIQTKRNYIGGNLGGGINIGAGGNSTIQDNYIGLGNDGETAVGNGSNAVFGGLLNAGGVVINGGTVIIGSNRDGVNDANEGNVISGNYGQGVIVGNGDGSRIAGNILGLNASGTSAVGNQVGTGTYDFKGSTDAQTDPASLNGSGIIVSDFGGSVDNLKIENNIIASNKASGIAITSVIGGGGTGQNWLRFYRME